MLPTEDLFVYVYVLIDDLINASASAIAIPPRPGPVPACGDAELLAIAPVRHLLGRRSEAGFLAEVARDWAHLFGAGGWRWWRAILRRDPRDGPASMGWRRTRRN